MSWFHPDPPVEIIVIHDDDAQEVKLLKHILRELQAIRRELAHHYTIRVKGDLMAIEVGQSGTFAAQLEDNGNPIDLPSGSTFGY